ncbi:MAG: M20/M25/M40 family metallo-hydrolase [Geothrix sp.]|uniref:M20/M25/M40 family metallo-hydrolase n=1 Tax=Geothrix sp. TaxID=1962974 RepID=UPI0018311135|nr:M20/M25/M40 family metallo-hydrolase [Geothrix sp.]NWJ41212.1 M20/M25/M40 family metallo-hydrolase [Geothrix sp.]WIL20797.1 MAG: M20/M25/M40 family metallo-hydrolase [Geothrix sp.]
MNAAPADLRSWLSARLMTLCAAETTSGREDAGLPGLRALLGELGATVVEQPVAAGRTNVLALWGRPKVLFSTHLDTVPPYLPPRLEGDVLFGRGTCDAKGQIVAQLAAVRTLLAAGREGLAWLGVVGEETDSAGAAAALGLADRLGDLRVLINGEPTELKLATGQRGVQHVCLHCRGRAAHSGSPQLGHNATWPLLDWLQRLREQERPVDAQLGPELWNLGLLQAGEALNSVPAKAEAHLMARVVPGSTFLAEVRRLAPPEGSVDLRLDEPADLYPSVPGFDQAPMPFGSDAPALRALVPDRTVVLAGPGSITVAHTLDEHLTLADLEAGMDLNRRLALHFLGD